MSERSKGLEVFLDTLRQPRLSLSLSLVLSIHFCPQRQEEMAAGETQLYAKVSNKHKGRSTPSLLDTLLGMGFPAHTA